MNKKLEPFIYSIVGTLALLSLNFKSAISDSDIFWSIATGKWITTHKAFPVVDSFSWTIYGQEWLTHEWLYCFGAYNMFSIWGNVGLYAFSFLPIVFTIYFLYQMGKKCDRNNSYAFLLILTIGTLILYKLCIPFRAYIYALLFFTILIYLMYFKRESKLYRLYYVLLFMIWANFHISACMGIVILSIEMIRRVIICKRYQGLWIIMASILATLINPYGYKIWAYFIFTLTSMGESRSIGEWQAPDFGNLEFLAVYLVLASSIILWQFHYHKDLPPHKSDNSISSDEVVDLEDKSDYDIFSRLWGLFVVFAQKNFTSTTCLLVLFWGFYIYSLYSIRMIFYTIILWIIVASWYIGKTRKLDFTMRTYWILAGLFLSFFVCNLSISNPSSRSIFEYNYKISPVEEVRFLKENPIYQNHLFNTYMLGGYLILNDIPVFIDARADSYMKFGIFKKYREIASLLEAPQKVLDECRVENIIEVKGTPFDRYMAVNTKWRLVYEGPTACIYTRIVDR